MEIFYVLLILLVITRAFGEVAVRLGQPALVGELLAGIALGAAIRFSPSSFPVMHAIPNNDVFTAITDLGIFFLMLMAGLEMRPREIAEKSKGAMFIAAGGLIIPLLVGFSLGWFFLPRSEIKLAQTLFIGTALAITAVPVAAKVLMDLDKLRSTAGKMILSAAIIDDILGLLLLAVLTAVIRTGEMPDPAGLLWLVGQIVLFIAIVTAIGLYVLPRLERVFHRSMSEEFEFSILLVVAFGFAVLAEALHMHFILGAFAAGLFFTKRTMDSEVFKGVQSRISGITTGFLAPVFFASIGLHLDVAAFTSIPLFLAVLIVAAVLCKLIGAGLPAYWIGLSGKDSLIVGFGMSGRGAVELIIADIALRAGLFSHPDPPPAIVANLFSAIVIMAVVTTLLTPIGLRLIVSRVS
ncbi:cation:proton antiporter [Desulfosarcina sp.]|uniref:cation:proton antiporter n=1 Tax=Desulfosarcina sp. TaxID=2027861 RepID=UPI003970A9C7